MSDNRTAWVRVVDWWLARVWPDLMLVAFTVLGHWVLYRFGFLDFAVVAVSPEQRRFIYVGLATVAALAAGSNNTAVGSYVSSAGDIMKQVRVSHGGSMRKSLRSNGMWLWAVAVTSLVCLAIDPMSATTPECTRGAAWLAQAAFVLIAVKYVRLVMMQDVLLAANDLSRQNEIKDERRKFKRPPVAQG